MIFNEIYGCYYNAVAKMIELAIDGNLTEKEMNRIVSERAFDESMLSIVSALRQQDWQLIDENFNTPISEKPTMPLTVLQKRWLKTILIDPRIALFDVSTKVLDDVEPLFYPGDIVYFDKYLDGDDYTDPGYIRKFHIVMQAIREHRKIKMQYRSSKNKELCGTFASIKMEYSDKEDKFRVLSAGKWDLRTVNMGRIIKCELLEEKFDSDLQLPNRRREKVSFTLTDTRNSLERAMMKFTHYKKQVEKVGDDTYHVELEYDKEDETDVLIQIMTFGSFINIIGPETMKQEMEKRLSRQLLMLEW